MPYECCFDDKTKRVGIKVPNLGNDVSLLPEEISSKVIERLVLEAERYRGLERGTIEKAVITVPAYFDQTQVDATINVVADIKSAVGDATTVILDGGIRSGQDIFKAYALGADFALIGRSWVYALAAAGERGITDLLTTFKGEIEISMALTGVTESQAIDHTVLKAKT